MKVKSKDLVVEYPVLSAIVTVSVHPVSPSGVRVMLLLVDVPDHVEGFVQV